MKILVVEDNLQNQDLARTQLPGHELTIVGNFTDALNLLYPGQNEEGDDAEPECGKFDVLLSDMNIPLGSSIFIQNKNNRGIPMIRNGNEEILPLGAIICLVAIINKIPKVGIVSAGNNHKDAVTAALTMARISINWGNNKSFVIEQDTKDFAGVLKRLTR